MQNLHRRIQFGAQQFNFKEDKSRTERAPDPGGLAGQAQAKEEGLQHWRCQTLRLHQPPCKPVQCLE
jgi:hypothetical protein